MVDWMLGLNLFDCEGTFCSRFLQLRFLQGFLHPMVLCDECFAKRIAAQAKGSLLMLSSFGDASFSKSLFVGDLKINYEISQKFVNTNSLQDLHLEELLFVSRFQLFW